MLLDPFKFGDIALVERDRKFLLAAPHGGFDLNTELIVPKVAEAIGVSELVATGFRKLEKPINVNRPTEGVRMRLAQEARTPEAAAVYEAYRDCVLSFGSRGPRLYVEIHGHGNTKVGNAIEIATVGMSIAEAIKIKKIFERAVAGQQFAQTPGVNVEGVDKVVYVAGGSKAVGILSRVKRALHIELPQALRLQEIEPTQGMLIQALQEIKSLALP
jgi:hypothetical protein